MNWKGQLLTGAILLAAQLFGRMVHLWIWLVIGLTAGFALKRVFERF